MLKFVEKFGYINKPAVCLQSQNDTTFFLLCIQQLVTEALSASGQQHRRSLDCQPKRRATASNLNQLRPQAYDVAEVSIDHKSGCGHSVISGQSNP